MQRESRKWVGQTRFEGHSLAVAEEPDNLDDKRNERQRLDEALKLNEPLATAYYMKEELRNIWHQRDKLSAQNALDEWVKKRAASDVNMLKQFSKTIAAHRSGITTCFDFNGLSTGPLKGTNNKIKNFCTKWPMVSEMSSSLNSKLWRCMKPIMSLSVKPKSTHLPDEP
ncbi:MAG: transposase, partial [Nitrosomonas sp.]|nr:transposase [Nitrosomonas sp.]